jgi:hypothetical protein
MSLSQSLITNPATGPTARPQLPLSDSDPVSGRSDVQDTPCHAEAIRMYGPSCCAHNACHKRWSGPAPRGVRQFQPASSTPPVFESSERSFLLISLDHRSIFDCRHDPSQPDRQPAPLGYCPVPSLPEMPDSGRPIRRKTQWRPPLFQNDGRHCPLCITLYFTSCGNAFVSAPDNRLFD